MNELASGIIAAVCLLTPISAQKPYVPQEQVTYVATTSTPVYDKPEPGALVVNTFRPMAILIVRSAAGGWMYVEPGTVKDAQTEAPGWIKADQQDIIHDDLMAVLTRREAASKQQWPASVKLDLMRGRVRIGFTKEQVALAYRKNPSRGIEPTAKHSEETAAGVIETWVYPDAAYTLKNGRVTKITKAE